MDWDEYFLSMLDPISARSRDRHTKVGCVIVGPDHEIRSTGYNSLPRGIDDSVEERWHRPEKYLWIEHADRNAIYNAARHGASLKGCTMYLSFPPCMDCARGIVQVGIIRVVCYTRYKGENQALHLKHFERVQQLFKEAKIPIEFFLDTAPLPHERGIPI